MCPYEHVTGGGFSRDCLSCTSNLYRGQASNLIGAEYFLLQEMGMKLWEGS